MSDPKHQPLQLGFENTRNIKGQPSSIQRLLDPSGIVGEIYQWPDGTSTLFVCEWALPSRLHSLAVTWELCDDEAGNPGGHADTVLLTQNAVSEVRQKFIEKGVPSEQIARDVQNILHKLPQPIVPPSGFLAEDIPRLSKVYQVKPDSQEQLIQLFWDQFPEPSYLYGASDEIKRGAFQDMERVCRLAQRIMTTLFEQNGVAMSDFLELGLWLERSGETSGIYMTNINAYAQDIIPAEMLTDQSLYLREPITGEIAEALRALIVHARHMLRRCVECNSIFVHAANKKTQSYCSHRCSHRVGTRNRRTKTRKIQDTEGKQAATL